MVNKDGAIAILTHWRTGSTLLRDVLAACGMKDCNAEIGFEYGDINGVGNSLCNGHEIDGDPAKIVSGALHQFANKAFERGWNQYGVKIDHALQEACWDEVGGQFEVNWPNARFVTSVRHPSGVIKSIEKLRKTVKLDPDFTMEEVIDSYLSTHDATKYLIEKKDALVVVYPDSYVDESIKTVVDKLGLTWTKAAGDLFKAVTTEFEVIDDKGLGLREKYLEAVEMFEEFKKCAVAPEPVKSTPKSGYPKTSNYRDVRSGDNTPKRDSKNVRPVQSRKSKKKSP